MANTDSEDPAVLAPPGEQRLFPLLSEGPNVVEVLTGRRIHKTTLFRWMRDGIAGVKLRVTSVGGTHMTSISDLAAFWAAVSEARLCRREKRSQKRGEVRRG